MKIKIAWVLTIGIALVAGAAWLALGITADRDGLPQRPASVQSAIIQAGDQILTAVVNR